ncbi:MAG: hypothetical protein ACPLRR_01495 [Candidatus Saccharicenans sp.]
MIFKDRLPNSPYLPLVLLLILITTSNIFGLGFSLDYSCINTTPGGSSPGSKADGNSPTATDSSPESSSRAFSTATSPIPSKPPSPSALLQLAQRGLLAVWAAYSRSDANLGQFGARFLPEFSLKFDLQPKSNSSISARPRKKITNYHLPTPVNKTKLKYPASDDVVAQAAAEATADSANAIATAAPIAAAATPTEANIAPASTTTFMIQDKPDCSARSISTSDPTFSFSYHPDFSYPSPPSSPSSPSSLSVEFSLNIWGTLTIQQGAENQFRSQVKPYCLSLKYASNRFEARLGLQKISFGSAALIRPLMWFDRLDPRDPIQLTDGVYGLLLRTYISTRTNLWFWVLYGNN